MFTCEFPIQHLFHAALVCLLGLTTLTAAPAVETPGEVLKRENAKLQRFTLDNGMVCLLKEDHSAPVASIQIWVGVGSIHEQEFLGSGLSHSLEHMVFNGTPTRTANDLSKEIDQVGGSINAYTTLDRTVYYTEIPSQHWRVGFDALTDSIMHASLPAKEWKQEQTVILREFAMGKDSPERVMNKLAWDTAFRVHPYRIPTIGYEDVFRKVEREDLVTYFERNYVPDNMMLVIVGDINSDEVRRAIDDTLGPFPRRRRAPIVLPAEPTQLSPRKARKRGNYAVSRLTRCYPTVALSHPDTPALDVLASIMGHGRSSRLNQHLKEEQRLVQRISAWSYTPREAGLFGLSATFAPDKEDELLAALDREVDLLQAGTFTQVEIDKAVRQVLVSELSALTTMKGQADSYASGEFFAGDPLYAERYIAQIESITAADLQRVARQYLVESRASTALLTPAAEQASTAQAAADEQVLPERQTLANGATLVILPDHRLPFINVCIAFGGGLLSESEEQPGISALMADLLLRGTAQRSSAELASTVESSGGSLSHFSGYNSFGLKARFLTSDRPLFTELLSDVVQSPAFPEAELAKQRALQIAALARNRERPMYLAQESLRQMLFAGHPYRHDRLGTPASLEGITRADVAGHYRALATAPNVVICISGQVNARTAAEIAEAVLGKLATTAPPKRATTAPRITEQERILREPREQSIVLLGVPGLTMFDPRADALAVLEQSMSGLASPLATRVRGERALAYFVGAFQQQGLDPGLFAMYAGTTDEHADEVVALFKEEIARVTQAGLSSEEFERATRKLIASDQISRQDPLRTAMNCALSELYGLGYQHALGLAERLGSLSREAVRSVAGDLLREDCIAVSQVRPSPAEKESK